MPKKCETSGFSKYFELPNPSLRSYFGRVVQGQPDEYRTPFYKGKSVTQILDEWMPHLDVLKNKWPTLFEFENDLAKKVGPMSIMLPLKERIPDIDSYYDSILLESKPIPKSAVDAVIKEFGAVRGLRLRSQERTVELMKKSTNSGSPFFRKRRDVTEDTIPCSVHVAELIQYLSSTDAYEACAVLGWRGQ
jgi:hypothetical protein